MKRDCDINAVVVTNLYGKKILEANVEIHGKINIHVNLEILRNAKSYGKYTQNNKSRMSELYDEFISSKYYSRYLVLIDRLIPSQGKVLRDEERLCVYNYISYWDNVLENEEIKHAFFVDFPHMAHEIVLIYLLSRKQIPITILGFMAGGRIVVTDSDYKRIEDSFISEFGLPASKIFKNSIKNACSKEITKYDKNLIKTENITFTKLIKYCIKTIKAITYTKKLYDNSYYIFETRWPPKYINELLIEIRTLFYSILAKQFYSRRSKQTFSNLKNYRNYVYMPLNTQFETTSQPGMINWAPTSLINHLLMYLPSDICVIVKEHPATFTFRPHQNFVRDSKIYKIISNSERVIFAPYNHSQFNLIDNALFTLTVGTTTSCLEAIALGKPLLIVGINPFSQSSQTSSVNFKNVLNQEDFAKMMDMKFLDIKSEDEDCFGLAPNSNQIHNLIDYLVYKTLE